MRIRHHVFLAAGLAGLLTAAAVAAPPSGAGRPSTPSHPTTPVGAPGSRPATMPSPLGRATSAPDTDRGRSEGRGHTDKTSTATRTTGTVVSFSGATLTLKLPTGVTKTFTMNGNGGRLAPGTPVIVTTNANGNVVSVRPANQSITGTVVGTTKTTVTLKLPKAARRPSTSRRKPLRI